MIVQSLKYPMETFYQTLMIVGFLCKLKNRIILKVFRPKMYLKADHRVNNIKLKFNPNRRNNRLLIRTCKTSLYFNCQKTSQLFLFILFVVSSMHFCKRKFKPSRSQNKPWTTYFKLLTFETFFLTLRFEKHFYWQIFDQIATNCLILINLYNSFHSF